MKCAPPKTDCFRVAAVQYVISLLPFSIKCSTTLPSHFFLCPIKLQHIVILKWPYHLFTWSAYQHIFGMAQLSLLWDSFMSSALKFGKKNEKPLPSFSLMKCSPSVLVLLAQLELNSLSALWIQAKITLKFWTVEADICHLAIGGWLQTRSLQVLLHFFFLKKKTAPELEVGWQSNKYHILGLFFEGCLFLNKLLLTLLTQYC